MMLTWKRLINLAIVIIAGILLGRLAVRAIMKLMVHYLEEIFYEQSK